MMRYRVVYVLLSYNQSAFITESVRSALAQDHEPLEILISDDASSDDTFARIEAATADYSGPHAIRLNRNPARMGSVDHLAHVGDIIGDDAFMIMAHGDDVSTPNRTRILVETWRRKRVSMVSSDVRWLGGEHGQRLHDRPSRLISASEIIEGAWMPEMLGAALAFETRIINRVRRLSSETLGWGIDHVLPLRAAAMKGFYYVAEPLVGYRRHADNMSNFVSDRTGCQEALIEGLLSYEMAIRHNQRADLLAIRRSHPIDPRKWLLLRRLDRRLMSDIGRWSTLRAALKAKGLSPTWIPSAEMRARKIVWETAF